MSFNRRILPNLEELVELRKSFESDSEFIKRIIGKSDVVMGPSDSMAFISEIRKQIDGKKENSGDRSGQHQ